jgi:L,D-transpeptidase-like protein
MYRSARSTVIAVLLAISGVAVAAAPATGRSRPHQPSVADPPDPAVLRLAFAAAQCAEHGVAVPNPRILTVIDYSRPSTRPRLWVLDRDTRRVLFEELVAHGRGSGENRPDRFSNEPGSLASSLGLFLTDESYVGTKGYSLRLVGLEAGVNDRALERAIVVHGAPYVRVGMESLGRLGRSWGCPAVRLAVARPIIDTIKGGTLLFAYYPDAEWLHGSRFLRDCTGQAGVRG